MFRVPYNVYMDMTCARCGQANPPGARFCANCGIPLAADQIPMQAGAAAPVGVPRPIVMPPAFAPRRTSPWPWVIGCLLAMVAALFGLNAAGLLKLGGSVPGANLASRGKVPGIHLQEKGQVAAPALQAKGQTAVPMPDDVYNWLKHLEAIEKKKQDLAAQQTSQIALLQNTLSGAEGLSVQDVQRLTDPDSTSSQAPALEKAVAAVNDLDQGWIALRQSFEGVPPPPECKPIGESFDAGLTGMVDQIQSVKKVLNGFGHNGDATPEEGGKAKDELNGIRRRHPMSIDSQFMDTDTLVQNICDKYNTRKWFSIDAHGGSTNALSGMGVR